MPIRRTLGRRVGITAVPERVEISRPFGTREGNALDSLLASLVRAPLPERLEELKAEIGARLEALGFPATLGLYKIKDARQIEPGKPGRWQKREAAPSGRDETGENNGTVPPAWARHPALIQQHEGTAPWLLAKALQKLALVQAHIDKSRPLEVEDLVLAAYCLGDNVCQASIKLEFEDFALRGERDREHRAAGGKIAGKRRHEAAEAKKREWRAGAAELWQRNPRLSTSRVAGLVRSELSRAGMEASGQSTVEQAINDLNPSPRRRRRKSS